MVRLRARVPARGLGAATTKWRMTFCWVWTSWPLNGKRQGGGTCNQTLLRDGSGAEEGLWRGMVSCEVSCKSVISGTKELSKGGMGLSSQARSLLELGAMCSR